MSVNSVTSHEPQWPAAQTRTADAAPDRASDRAKEAAAAEQQKTRDQSADRHDEPGRGSTISVQA